MERTVFMFLIAAWAVKNGLYGVALGLVCFWALMHFYDSLWELFTGIFPSFRKF